MLIVECPHCKETIVIEQINCQIFRHAAYKQTGEPIPPHAPLAECELLLSQDQIFGCAKPFKLLFENEEWVPVKCDYI